MTGRVDVVAGVIALHYRRDIGSCACGRGEATGDLGRSHAAHVAELALAAADRVEAEAPPRPSMLAWYVEAWLASDDDRWVRLGEDLRDLVDPVVVDDCPRCTPARVEPERGRGYCDEQGPWGARCTDDAGHRYAHQDHDASFLDDWREDCAATGHVRRSQT
jgi:hypothetical protein